MAVYVRTCMRTCPRTASVEIRRPMWQTAYQLLYLFFLSFPSCRDEAGHSSLHCTATFPHHSLLLAFTLHFSFKKNEVYNSITCVFVSYRKRVHRPVVMTRSGSIHRDLYVQASHREHPASDRQTRWVTLGGVHSLST